MKSILQTEASECGLACLAMMSSYFGCHIELPELRRRFPTSLKGMNLQTLIRLSDSLRMAARPVRADLDEIEYLDLPCIIHWSMNHFVVLERIAQRKGRPEFVIIDPGYGERCVSLQEFSRCYTGVAIEVVPTPKFEKNQAQPAISVGDLTGPIKGLKGAAFQALVLALALEVLSIVSPLFNQFIIDEAIVSGDTNLMVMLVLGFGLVLVTRTIIELSRSWFLMRWGIEVEFQWSSRVLSHLIKLPISYFEKRHVGDIVSKFGSLTAIQNTLTTLFVESALDGLMAVLLLAVMFTYNAQLALIVVFTTLIYACLRWAFFSPLREASRERIVLAAKESSNFLETVRAITPIKLFDKESQRRSQWQNLRRDVINRDIKTQRLGLMFRSATTAVSGFQNMALLYLGSVAVMESRFTVGMMMAFMTYAGTFTSRSFGLIDIAVNVKMLTMHSERLADIVLEPEEEHVESQIAEIAIDPSITLKNVSFRYSESEPWVIKDFNLHIPAGQSVALTGASGCGKSTLCKIIVGLLQPTEGEIHIGGTPLRKIGMRRYRQILGTVMQNDVLLAGSIFENITFFDNSPNRAKVEQVCKLASIHADIVSMPMGFQTLVGDMGSILSGGQKQRVLLARALYRDPEILAIDEGTSHLDIENERNINNSLRKIKLTKIMVAHRVEAINSADRVIELSTGSIVLSDRLLSDSEDDRLKRVAETVEE